MDGYRNRDMVLLGTVGFGHPGYCIYIIIVAPFILPIIHTVLNINNISVHDCQGLWVFLFLF